MSRKPPKYALHKPTGQARVRINGKDIYLGKYDSPESHAEYDRLLARHFLGTLDVERDSLSIARIAIMYVTFAKSYYLKDGLPTSEIHAIQMALKPLTRMFGREKIHTFGPRKLNLVREEMIRLAPIWSMIRLQLCTGARPGEVCIMRACDIDVSGPVWEFTPKSHKTEHHNRQRMIFIGPRSQEILRPYLAAAKDDDYLFRPDDAEKVRNHLRKASRQSAMIPSQAKRKPKESPKRKPGERYQRTSYTRAIARACRQAKVPEWSPNQLRHNAATELRKIHGLDGTRTVLGHSSTDMTEVYAEIDFDAARKIMLASG